MKKIAKYLCLLFIPIGSCEYEQDPEEYGYPEEIEFPAEGGCYYFEACDNAYITLTIFSDNEEKISSNAFRESVGEGELYVEYEWLTVKMSEIESDLTVTAAPNTTGKSRKLELEISRPIEGYSFIKIKQAGK
ncbi:MAG: hypothetical protein E7082_04185 [Bacteroidales bacterium]|nr:hypothetical protein [Bacteroidales bacterium]